MSTTTTPAAASTSSSNEFLVVVALAFLAVTFCFFFLFCAFPLAVADDRLVADLRAPIRDSLPAPSTVELELALTFRATSFAGSGDGTAERRTGDD